MQAIRAFNHVQATNITDVATREGSRSLAIVLGLSGAVGRQRVHA